MIQFNLLPDVKIEFIKSQKAKRRVVGLSFLTVAISVGLMLVTVSAMLFQKHHLSDLDKDIKKYKTALNNTQDLSKILTIQHQLNTLPTLYAQRPVTSRLANYIQATTPSQISMTKLDMDFSTSTMIIEGSADTLESVNRYVDTLKFTTYSADDASTVATDSKPATSGASATDAASTAQTTSSTAARPSTKAFTNVVLTEFNRDAKLATFKVTVMFDKTIFDSSKNVTLNVPKTITTRSETELPGAVFDAKGSN